MAIRRIALTTIVLIAFFAITAASALADAGNPIIGTITGNVVTHPNGTVTVYVRGQWNWYSHDSDCNIDRAGAGVGLIWKDPTETGFTVSKGTVSADIGVKTKDGSWADPNPIDQTAHPADVGNVAEGYPGLANQVFVDPPLDPVTGLASAVLWKGGCGREPMTATASPGPLPAVNPSGKTCADGTLTCGVKDGEPWGSWGYQKQELGDGTLHFGYSHTYRQRSDLTSVCVNFYDVHGALQVVKSGDQKEIDVDANGDNSIETNAFNVLDGANCLSFAVSAPTLTTAASNATLTVGQSVTDTATLVGTAAAGPVTGTIQFQTCGPDLAANPVCTSANSTNLGAPVTIVNGQAQSQPFTPSLGHSCFRAVFTPDTGNYLGTTHTDQTVECVNVTPAQPAVATQASASVAVGGVISDSVTLSGGANPTGTITVKVYGPNDATCANAALFTDNITVTNGNNTYASPSHVINTAGVYRFVASYSGDANNLPVAGVCNAANESVTVTKVQPTVATQASASVVVGGSISDSVTLAGGVSPTGTITVKVYGPNDATCANAALFSDDIVVNGNGTYPSPAHLINTAGTYRFVASYSGNANNEAVAGVCNAANESVVVNKASPAVATQASSSVVLGGSISDSVMLSGGFSPTGTITVKVYGPNDATCANAALFSDDIAVNGNGTYPSPAHVITTPGTYRFVASYSGDANNNAVAGACNAANESVVVAAPAITIVKTPDQHVQPGGTANFTVTVTNTGTTVLTNVTVADPLSPDCNKAVGTLNPGQVFTYECSQANVVASFTNVATATGHPPVGPDVTATDDAVVTVDHPAILIKKAPATQTVISGGTATFTITVKNTGDVTLTNVVVTDALSPGCAKAVGTLAAGESTSYACTLANVTAGFTNVATATGQPPVGPDVTSTDQVPVLVVTPAISITKGPKSQTIEAGGTATFTITVKNTGQVALTNVTVTDAQAPGCAKVVGDLAIGQETSYTCTLANVPAGFTNVATVTAQPPVGPPVTSTDNAPVTVTTPTPPPPPPPAPAPRIDLAVTKTDSPDPLTLGGNLTYTMVVTNNGPNTATGVKLADPLPANTTFVSVATSTGTCTGGTVISCSLGTMTVGQSVTVTLVVKPTVTGTVSNTVTVVGNESETNTANNTATAPTLVVAPFTPPPPTPKPKPVCVAVAAAPKQLTANGKFQTLNLVVTQAGKAATGVRVNATGAGINMTSGKSNAKGKTSLRLKLKKAGIILVKPQASLTCNARVGVIGVFKPPVTG